MRNLASIMSASDSSIGEREANDPKIVSDENP